MHAVINPVIVLFLGWEVGLGGGGDPGWGCEQGRRWWRGGRGEGWRGADRLFNWNPPVIFGLSLGSKCSYCFMAFAHKCQTMFGCLLSYQTPVRVSRLALWLQRHTCKNTHTHARRRSRREAVFVSCNTNCSPAVKKRGMCKDSICSWDGESLFHVC